MNILNSKIDSPQRHRGKIFYYQKHKHINQRALIVFTHKNLCGEKMFVFFKNKKAFPLCSLCLCGKKIF